MNTTAQASPVLLTADQMITGRDQQVIRDAAVLTRGEIILWAGPARSVPARDARDAHHIPLPGATLLPGLVDAHTHLVLDGADDPFATVGTFSSHQLLAQMRRRARAMVNAGITTVRDLGAPMLLDAALAREIRAGRTPGPRILAAGVPLTVHGGHLAAFGGAVSTLGEAHNVIRANRAAGCRWTKIVITGGFTSTAAASPYRSHWDQTLLRQIVQFSHTLKLPVAAHAHGTAGIRAAIQARVDSIEHCTWMLPDPEADDDLNPDALLLDAMSHHSISVGTTVNSRAARAAGRLPWGRRLRQLDIMRRHTTLTVGTDAGIAGTPHTDLPASLVLYRELYRDTKTPNLHVIELATSCAARAIGANTTGVLAPGRTADVLAVVGDPATDLSALRRPLLVMARGVVNYATTPDRKKATR
ncbi:amidohydrolase family protein [Kitasatospora sp. NPDC056076]|uniref:amidohydrolase family protein n=1 Tax=Kitasatospora sp. NPDC056076 TaxID=3345703 RepID=UPI0035D921F5